MPLVSTNLSTHQEARRHARGTRTGTRVEADFTIDLGFTPIVIKVINLTDRLEHCLFLDATLDGGANLDGIFTLATGVKTYVPSAISLTADERGFTVDISVNNIVTDDDDIVWEAWS